MNDREPRLSFHERTRTFLLILMAAGIGMAIGGCGAYWHPKEMQYTRSIKTAWLMYDQRRDDLGPPNAAGVEAVEAIGREQFVADLSKFVHTKYAPEALYALGSFGDRSTLRLVAECLSNRDSEVRRVALSSLGNLTGQSFASTEEAGQWWAAYGQSVP